MTSVGVRRSHQSPAIVSSLLCIPPCLVEAIITPFELEADGLLWFSTGCLVNMAGGTDQA